MGIACLLGGCLAWTPPGNDDDSAAVDDDDSTVDDDDSAPADDDDATSAELPVDQAANGAVLLVRFEGVDTGAVTAAVFADQVLTPSAEEAALQELTEVTLATTAPADGFRDMQPDEYEGPYGLETDGLFALVDGVSLPLTEEFDGGWGSLDLSPGQVEVGSEWTAQFTGAGPYSGFHEAEPIPGRPTLAGEGLLGPMLFLKPGQGIAITATPSSPIEPDIFTLTGFETSARAWAMTNGALSIPAADLPPIGAEGAPFFHQRNVRVRVDQDPSLVLMSGNWLIGQVVQLGTTDSFLRPADAEPGEIATGQTLTFTPEPALANPSLPYTVSIGNSDLEATIVGGDVQVTVTDPVDLGWGWMQVEMALPGGFARSAIRVGQAVPPCDVQEFGSNDALGGANPFAAGQVLCGEIESAGDADFARFDATFGATYEVQVWNQRLGARGSIELSVLDALGAEIAQGEYVYDGDQRLQYTATASGPVFLRVRDGDGGTGPQYVWRLQVRALP